MNPMVGITFGMGLFFIGMVGVLIRRNAIIVLMCIELMLNGVNVLLVTFAGMWNNLNGQIFALFVITVAAGEAAVGLSILIALFRLQKTVYVDQVSASRG